MDNYKPDGQLPHIDQNVIECDLRAFTRWLNSLVDNVNWLSKAYLEMKDKVDDHEQRIKCLEERVDSLEERMDHMEECCEEVRDWIAHYDISAIEQAINMVNGRVDNLYRWLPIPYGLIDGKGWKFAMGNISVMSDNNETPSIDGAGIYTSGQIENNDLYFN